MSQNKRQLRIVPRSAAGKAGGQAVSAHPETFPNVPARWLLSALGLMVLAAAGFVWITLCLLFWQGSWQLLYHPNSKVARTPASVGLAYDPIGFAATDTGKQRLRGWWIAAAPAVPGAPGLPGSTGSSGPTSAPLGPYTVLYLHGQSGNLGDSVNTLVRLHALGVNVFAFDYRGYGQSQFARPSERRWRQDANWALDYLIATRHVDPRTIVLEGDQLGANLALEIAATRPGLAGVVLESPVPNPMAAIFADPRARLVPARLLVQDRYNLKAAAASLHIPSLWFLPAQSSAQPPDAYRIAPSPKTLV